MRTTFVHGSQTLRAGAAAQAHGWLAAGGFGARFRAIACAALLCAIALLLACAPQPALAEEPASPELAVATQADDPEIVATGYCTANPDALWTLDAEGTMTFTLKEGATKTLIGSNNTSPGPTMASDIDQGKGITSGSLSVEDVKRVVVSQGITAINYGFFNRFINMEEIQLPEGIERLVTLFLHCESLESIFIPDSVTYIYNCFGGCYSLKDVRFSGNSKLASLGINAFEYCKALESIQLPETVTTISHSAFNNCTALKNVVWPARCQAVPDFCFKGCTALNSITLPEGVKSIGTWAFKDCTSLVSVTIPDTCTSIVCPDQMGASGVGSLMSFRDCTALSDFVLGESGHYEYVDGRLTERETGRLVFDKGNPNADGIVKECGNKDIVNLVVGKTVSSISKEAFEESYGIRSITVEEGNEHFCVSDDGILYTKDMTELVKVPNSLASFEVPDTLEKIHAYAFRGCSDLEAVDLTNLKKLKNVDVGAFSDCAKLASVELPDCVSYIGAGAFAGTAIESFRVPADLWAGHEDDYQTFFCYDPTVPQRSPNGAGIFFGDGADAYIPENAAPIKELDLSAYGRTFIPPYMFAGLDKLESITIPACVTTIETGAFYECTSLSSVTCYSQSLDVAGGGETGDSSLGWTASTPPSFGINTGVGRIEYSIKPDIVFHGLAYSESDVLSYCKSGGGTFVPIVYLGGMTDNELAATFGDSQGWDDYSSVSSTFEKDGALGSALGVTAAFLDTAVGNRNLEAGADFTATCVDAKGASVSGTADAGMYRLTIVGNGSDVLGSKTFTYTRKAQSINAKDVATTYGAKPFSLNATASGGGALSYQSTNAKVADVSSNGTVTVKKVGTATIAISAAATGDYAKAAKTVHVKVNKASQPMALSKITRTVKASKLKKANQTVAGAIAKKAVGAVSYAIAKTNKAKAKFAINKKTGKITVKKGTKSGAYKLTVKASAKGNTNYKSGSKTAVVTVKVK